MDIQFNVALVHLLRSFKSSSSSFSHGSYSFAYPSHRLSLLSAVVGELDENKDAEQDLSSVRAAPLQSVVY